MKFKMVVVLAVAGTRLVGQGGHGSDTAVVVPVPAHQDVTAHAPRGTPGVLDDPVSLAASLAVADREHTVIQLSGRAGGLIVDTARIHLEGGVGCIDGNAGGALRNLGLQIRLAAGGNVDISCQSGSAVGGIVLAGTVLSSVRIRSLSVNTVVLDDVLESISHQTAVAALVALTAGAVNEVLLRKADKSAGVECVSTLNGASGGE